MNPHTRTTRRSALGFTLLELILVLVLIATLTTLATPALSGFARRAALDNTAVELFTLTQQAQTRAIHEANTYRVVINLEQREAYIEHIGDEGYEQTVGTGVESVQWNNTIEIDTDVEKSGYNEIMLYFEPTGLVTPGTVIVEQEDRFVVITCEAATERYRIMGKSEVKGLEAQEVLNALRL